MKWRTDEAPDKRGRVQAVDECIEPAENAGTGKRGGERQSRACRRVLMGTECCKRDACMTTAEDLLTRPASAFSAPAAWPPRWRRDSCIPASHGRMAFGVGCFAADVAEDALDRMTRAAQAVSSNVDLVAERRRLFLAVKPQHAATVLREMRDAVTASHLLVSIAAGIQSLRRWPGIRWDGKPIIRVMPNTPCLVGAGASAFAAGRGQRRATWRWCNGCCPLWVWRLQLDESLLDAVTGLSGSGPAYVFQIIEALSDGGVRVGSAAAGCDATRRPDAAGRGENGAGIRRASRRAERRRRQSRRYDDRRPARARSAAACGRR